MQLVQKVQNGIRSMFGLGQTEVAQWMLDKLLNDHPNLAHLHYDRAMLAHENNDAQTAEKHFEQAARLAPENTDYQLSLGDFYHVTQGRAEAALSQYQKVLQLQPNHLDALLTSGHLCVASRQFDQARGFYQRVLAIEPDHADAQRFLNQLLAHISKGGSGGSAEALYQNACELIESGRREEAVQVLEKLVAIDSAHASAHNDLGVLYAEGDELEKAHFHYERAVELAPENGMFLKNVADYYYHKKSDIKKALEKYVQALTLDPADVEALMGTGNICMVLEHYADARTFFEKIIETEPWHQHASEMLRHLDTLPTKTRTPLADEQVAALYAAAQEKANDGNIDGAIADLNAIIAQDPNHAPACNDLGVLHYEKGDKDKALVYYEEAVRLNPDNANFMKNLADFFLLEQGRTEEAMKVYIKVLESNPEDTDCLLAAGIICERVERQEDARVFYDRVLEIEPRHHQAREALSRLGTDAGGDSTGAVVDFKQQAAL